MVLRVEMVERETDQILRSVIVLPCSCELPWKILRSSVTCVPGSPAGGSGGALLRVLSGEAARHPCWWGGGLGWFPWRVLYWGCDNGSVSPLCWWHCLEPGCDLLSDPLVLTDGRFLLLAEASQWSPDHFRLTPQCIKVSERQMILLIECFHFHHNAVCR